MTPAGNIYLIGFSGTGKSMSGIKAAELLRLPFVDMDDLIEYRTRKSIPEIFADDGESEFRRIETELLRELAQKRSRVVSTGGGVPVLEVNRGIMRASGCIVLLTASPAPIHLRLTARNRSNRALRPLLGDTAPVERVADLLEARGEAYSCADLTIDTDDLTHGQVAESIFEQCQTLLARRAASGSAVTAERADG